MLDPEQLEDALHHPGKYPDLVVRVAGSPCPKTIIETFQEKGVVFNQGYGMTETATGVTALGSEDSLRKLGRYRLYGRRGVPVSGGPQRGHVHQWR